jgi:hypothetical protein
MTKTSSTEDTDTNGGHGYVRTTQSPQSPQRFPSREPRLCDQQAGEAGRGSDGDTQNFTNDPNVQVCEFCVSPSECRYAALVGAPPSALYQEGGSPSQADALRPETNGNCVAARRGGEQPEVCD